MILFVQVLWYTYSWRKHKQDFQILSSYGMTSWDIYLVSASPMLAVLSLSSLIGGLLSSFQTKGITSLFFGSATFLVLTLLFLLASCFIHRRGKKNVYPKKISSFSLRRNVPFLIIDGLITALSMFFLSCLVFDGGRMKNLTEEEYPVYRMLGLEGITVQSYLFPFLALLLVIVFTGFLFDYFIIDDIKGNLFLLVVKGDEKTSTRTEAIYGLSALFSMGLSILLYYFAVLSMNAIFHTSIPIFVFDPRVLVLAFSVLLFRLLLFSFVLKQMLKPKRLLSYLRERY